MNKELAKRDLLDFKKILDKYHTKFFLIYGTALGAYREGDFIAHDEDIDLGTFDNTHFENIRKELEEIGFTIGVCYDIEKKQEIPATMVLSERNIRVDLYFFEKEGEDYVAWKHKFSYHPFLFMPKKFSKTKLIKFLGRTFNIITPTEEYLEFLYGDWKNPEAKRQGRLYAEIKGIKKDVYL